MKNQQHYDVIIIGGSYAGLSAAMTLGRALRSVLVIDSGKPCNRFTPHAHNLITHDGKVPSTIAHEAKLQVLQYPTVQVLEDRALEVHQKNDEFMIVTDKQLQFFTTKLIFATGVKDLLPAIDGFQACWGKTVIHCPYCHGYEVRGQKTGILVNDESVTDFYQLIAQWTNEIAIFTNGVPQFDTEKFPHSKVEIVVAEIKALAHLEGNLQYIELNNGDQYILDAIYFRPPFEQHCDIPAKMACQFTESGHIEVNQFMQTSIKGIYAAGDCTTPFRSLAMAISQGNIAGAMLNHELIHEKHG